MNDESSLKHTRWECKYHIVWIPKYRKKSLFGQLRTYLGQVFRDLARSRESEEKGTCRQTMCICSYLSLQNTR